MNFFPTTQRPKHLVEFNAGKCIREGNMIKPDLRKGIVYMDQSDDQLMHFYWKERRASEPEEVDLIIFPDEAEMVRVDECTTGRVYLLKFKSSNQKLFFWMQSKSDEKDEEVVKRVNQLVNDPQAAVMDDSPMDYNSPGGSSADMMQLLGGTSGRRRTL
ncbi:proteasome complex subunit Rpn13 ubiquitin receptor-domain-containing protein [Dichotomocladium elegans]|nr:proteasome complex subunit Rpn13 ubiquitin receptor-domain-containing protein [Dichotomocladium elegans]